MLREAESKGLGSRQWPPTNVNDAEGFWSLQVAGWCRSSGTS
jgi:hypothetical protein